MALCCGGGPSNWNWLLATMKLNSAVESYKIPFDQVQLKGTVVLASVGVGSWGSVGSQSAGKSRMGGSGRSIEKTPTESQLAERQYRKWR